MVLLDIDIEGLDCPIRKAYDDILKGAGLRRPANRSASEWRGDYRSCLFRYRQRQGMKTSRRAALRMWRLLNELDSGGDYHGLNGKKALLLLPISAAVFSISLFTPELRVYAGRWR